MERTHRVHVTSINRPKLLENIRIKFSAYKNTDLFISGTYKKWHKLTTEGSDPSTKFKMPNRNLKNAEPERQYGQM